ncbi:MAG TPA: DoxX family protein [Gemmatimonadales bacterium]
MSPNHPATSRRLDAGLTILRVVTGIIFAAHGGQKLFVHGLDGVAGAFAQMGIPMASVVGPLVALVELLGGLALIAGLFTRLSAVGLAITMLGAIFLVHIGGGFFAPEGIEFNLALLGASLTLVLTGAGAFSADGMMAGRDAVAARAR